MKKFLKKLLGFDEMETALAETIRLRMEAEQAIKNAEKELAEAEEANRIALLSPKELATEKKEPWVAVINTHVNQDNIRNGFFELDWNEYFVLQLKQAGYKGDTDEAVVDQWFQELCRNVGAESGIGMESRSSGYINVNNLGNGKSEVS